MKMATAVWAQHRASLRCHSQQQLPGPRFALTQAPRPAVSLGRTCIAPQCRQHASQRRQIRLTVASAAGSTGDDASAAASGSNTSSSGGHGSGGRHAFLHDFCMCLPYGALVAAGGLVCKMFGWGQPAIVMMVVGALQLGLSSLSLKVWRQNKSAAPFTLVEAGLAGWLAYYAYRGLQQGVSQIVMGCLLGLSAAMALFLAYNVAAGGNPPRRGSHAAAAALSDAEPASAPAS